MTAEELADEIGRTADWVYRNWRDQVVNRKLPRPLHNGIKPLAWSRAHVYAFLDKDLTAAQRTAAAAFRAAAAAAAGEVLTGDASRTEGDWRAILDQTFAVKAEGAA